MGGPSIGEGAECYLSGGVLGLAQCGAEAGALEDLAVKVNGGLEPRRVVRPLSYTRVRWQIEAAPLGQLL